MITTTDWTRDDYIAAIQQLQTELRDLDAQAELDEQARRENIANEIAQTEQLVTKLESYRAMTDAQLAAIPVPTIIRELLTAHIDALGQQLDIAHITANN